MRSLMLGGVALLTVFATPAHAGFYDGNKINEWCQSSGAQIGLCAGYISGVADTAELLADKPICPHDGVEVGQMVDVVSNYLQRFPEKRHYPAQALVIVALSEAFPCP